jgi:hypothetical protein
VSVKGAERVPGGPLSVQLAEVFVAVNSPFGTANQLMRLVEYST